MFIAIGLAVSLPALAAPMDALLGTYPEYAGDTRQPSWLHLEAATDRVNDKIDLLGRKLGESTTRRGDYSGSHVGASMHVDRYALQAARWNRTVVDKVDSFDINSWQVAAQVRLNDDALAARSWAVRASIWGNQSDRLVRSMNTRLSVLGLSTRVNTIELSNASDRQQQLDLVMSQRLPGQTLSAFAGLGISRVANQGVSGSATIDKCPYALTFDHAAVTARPSGSCNASAPVVRAPNEILPYAAQPETNYGARYMHLGLSHEWQGETLGTKFGIDYQRWHRDRIDELIARRHGVAYASNTTLIGELNARVTRSLGVYLRTQFARHLFVGELPLAYNTITASRFGKSFSMFSLGLTADF